MDGLRAIAIILVLLGHYGSVDGVALAGVQLFFVLSGFLITRLLLAEFDANGTLDVRRFYLRRALRIMPAYFVLVGMTILVLYRYMDARDWSEVVSLLTYTSNYHQALFPGVPEPGVRLWPFELMVRHTWSLAVEEQFYLVWPLAMLWLLRAGGLRGLRIGLVAVICAVGTARTLAAAVGVTDLYIARAFELTADHLAAGCLLAALIHGPHSARTLNQLRAWLPPQGILCVAFVAVVALGYDGNYDWRVASPSVLIGALWVASIVAAPTRARWLSHAVARDLGRLSYSIYLWHAWGWFLGASLAADLGVGYSDVWQLGFTVSLALLSYHVVERSWLVWRDRWFPAR